MIPLDRCRRVLVVRTDHIGDLILSTPFLRALRRSLPEARILATLNPYTRKVLETTDLVDEILTRPAKKIDLAISLAPRSQSLKTVYASGARYRLGYYYSGRPLVALASRIWLTHRHRMEVDRAGKVAHEVEQLGCLARLLGIPYEPEHLELGIEPPEPEDLLVLHMGVRWFTGDWSPAALVDLARRLAALGRLEITYGPAEQELAAQVRQLAPDLNLKGGLSFRQWAQRLGAARAVVSCDTGAVHVAAALKRPVVVAYEPSDMSLCQQQWAPWRVPHRAVAKGQPEIANVALAGALEELLGEARNRLEQ